MVIAYGADDTTHSQNFFCETIVTQNERKLNELKLPITADYGASDE